MQLIGLMPIYQKPNTNKAAQGHKTYPYLLRELRVSRPNQVWAAAITNLQMFRGFSVSGRDHGLAHPQGFGVAVIEHAGSRRLCRGAEPGHRQVRPARVHEHRPRLAVHALYLDGSAAAVGRAPLDGRQGRFLDNIFVDRHCRRLKNECVYLLAWKTGSEARAGVENGCSNAPTFRPWRQASRRGPLAAKRNNQPRSAGAKSSLNYAENCPNIGEWFIILRPMAAVSLDLFGMSCLAFSFEISLGRLFNSSCASVSLPCPGNTPANSIKRAHVHCCEAQSYTRHEPAKPRPCWPHA